MKPTDLRQYGSLNPGRQSNPVALSVEEHQRLISGKIGLLAHREAERFPVRRFGGDNPPGPRLGSFVPAQYPT